MIACRFTCILCQATEKVGEGDYRPMVMTCFVQESTVLSRKREKPPKNPAGEGDEDGYNMPTLCLSAALSPGAHVNSCGHKMHYDCFNKYYENTVARESRRSFRRLSPPFDVEKQEFMCPLCNNLNNNVLPLYPPLDHVMSHQDNERTLDITLEEWVSIGDSIGKTMVTVII